MNTVSGEGREGKKESEQVLTCEHGERRRKKGRKKGKRRSKERKDREWKV